MKLKFLENATIVKSKFSQFFLTLNQRRCCKKPVLDFEHECIEQEEEEEEDEEEEDEGKSQDMWTTFLQTQKNQHIDLQDQLEIYCDVLAGFSFSGANYDIYLLKSYLLLLLVDERSIEPIVINKANQLYLSKLETFSC